MIFVFVSEIDLCVKQSPCQHGATCMNYRTYYTCQCMPGYRGRNCSEGERSHLLTLLPPYVEFHAYRLSRPPEDLNHFYFRLVAYSFFSSQILTSVNKKDVKIMPLVRYGFSVLLWRRQTFLQITIMHCERTTELKN